MNTAHWKQAARDNALSILGIIAAFLSIAAAGVVTAALIAWPESLETINRPDRIRQIGGALIWTALAGSIVKMVASGWRDRPGRPRNRISRAALAAGAAAIIIFSLGAAMALHPRLFH